MLLIHSNHSPTSALRVGLIQALAPYEMTMDAKQFVANWKVEKENYLASIKEPGTRAAKQVVAMHLSEFQTRQLWQLLDTAVTDVMYTLLLGLDGCACIGNDQHTFKILAEDGCIVSTCGEIEAEAYEQFHGGA